MTEREWQDRYEITSIKGRIWKRGELLKRATDVAVSLLLHKVPRAEVRAEIARSLDNDAFMRPRRGMVPARVIDDLSHAAFLTFWPGVQHG